MEVRIVACGIFQPELEAVLRQINEELIFGEVVKITYLDPAKHVNYDKLKTEILDSLNAVTEEKIILLYGSMCHPDIEAFTHPYQAIRPLPRNCIELIIDKEHQQKLQNSDQVFFMTPGWLGNWQNIFKLGQGWDEIEARQNFGFYDKIVLLDTGVTQLNDEDILDFFEYAQVPIVTESVELTYFKRNVLQVLKTALEENLGIKMNDLKNP